MESQYKKIKIFLKKCSVPGLPGCPVLGGGWSVVEWTGLVVSSQWWLLHRGLCQGEREPGGWRVESGHYTIYNNHHTPDQQLPGIQGPDLPSLPSLPLQPSTYLHYHPHHDPHQTLKADYMENLLLPD